MVVTDPTAIGTVCAVTLSFTFSHAFNSPSFPFQFEAKEECVEYIHIAIIGCSAMRCIFTLLGRLPQGL